MKYRALADLVVALHFLVVLFVVLGGAAVVWRRRVAWVHLPVVAWVIFAECFHRICPLTYLENHLRQRGAGEPYRGDFVAHYIMPVLYPDGLTDRLQIVLGAGVLLVNVALYCVAFRRKKTEQSIPDPTADVHATSSPSASNQSTPSKSGRPQW
jgi:hypothetical protein